MIQHVTCNNNYLEPFHDACFAWSLGLVLGGFQTLQKGGVIGPGIPNGWRKHQLKDRTNKNLPSTLPPTIMVQFVKGSETNRASLPFKYPAIFREKNMN